MKSQRGWIKVDRSLLEHWVFQDPLLLKVWIYVLLTANYEAKTLPACYGSIEIQRGQFFTSIRKLAARLDMDKGTVTRKLKALQSEGMVFTDSNVGKGTLITVCNYCLYQGNQADDISVRADTDADTDADTESDTDADKGETPVRTQMRHKQEYIKKEKERGKKEKEKRSRPGDPDYFEEVW